MAKIEQHLIERNLSLRSIVVDFSRRPRPRDHQVKNITNNEKRSQIKRSPLNNVVSRNITMVLENLLKNYESSQLPTHGKGKWVCTLSVTFNYVSEIFAIF